MQTGKILKNQDIAHIYQSALRVLDEIGVKCDHQRTVDLLREKENCRYENGRVFFPVNVIEEFFEKKIKPQNNGSDKVGFKMGGQWHSWEICDPLSNRPRPATMEDSIQMARLSEALGASRGPIPVAPGDMDPRLNTIVSEMIALIYTRNLGSLLTVTDKEEIRIIAEMHKAAGRKYTLGLEGMISPLKFNSETLAVYYEWYDDPDVDISIMCSIPMAGATAPLTFPAGLVLSLAEAIALDFFSAVISEGKLRNFTIRLEPFDFKSNNISFGSPEWCLCRQSVVELWTALTGNNNIEGWFRTNGKIVDGQTLIERTASFMWQASVGIRTFGAVGQLCIDEVYSPVQAVLDREILNYGKRAFAGINENCWNRYLDPVQLIRKGVEEDGFMMHETTLEVFRDMYDLGRMSSGCNLGIWKKEGSKTLEMLAWEEAQKIIAAYDFMLDDNRRADVEKLYQKGLKYLTGK